MEDIFKIDEQFDLQNDDMLKYFEKLLKGDFIRKSGLNFSDIKELESDYNNAIKKLQDPKKQSWGILDNEVAAIKQELARLIRLVKGFYLTSVDEYVHPTSNMSPQKIQYILNKLLKRVRKLELVLEPDYAVVKYKEKRNNENYTQIKGYWINDAGKRVRSISRSIGKTLSEDEEIAMRLIDINTNKDTKVTLHGRAAKFKADLSINDGKTIWIVETKLANRDSLIRNLVMFENWKMYKKEYKLLE